MKRLLCWLWLALAAWGEGGRLLYFDCVPRDFQVALKREQSWQPCPRNERNQIQAPSGNGTFHFRLMRAGYQSLELRIPAQLWDTGPEQRWPPRLNQVLTLAPQVVQTTFHTSPSGAQVFLVLPGGRRDYLGLSGQPLALNLARITGGSDRGFFEIELRHWACLPTRVPIGSYSFTAAHSRWPARGSLPLPGRLTGWMLALPPALALLWWLGRRRLHRGVFDNRPYLGDFSIGQPLGVGASGKVFRAVHRRSGQKAAVKVLHPHLADQPLYLSAFRRESALLAQLDHPNLVKVLEWGEDLGRPFLAMQLIEGCDLRTALAIDPLGSASLRSLLSQAAAGLACAHTHGIIHRDIKPENLVITPEGRACWVDFGLAEVMPEGDDTSGTVGYLAPERLAGAPASPASDQYSLGVLAFEALTGELPTVPVELLRRRPALDGRLAAIIERMLSADPKDRYPSLLEVESALWSCR